MVNRTTFSGASTPPLGGPDFLNQYAERIGTLFDASALPLTGVGGTADAVTATLDPPLAPPGTFVDGMKFTLTWAAANTAGVTLAINGGSALAVVDAKGAALAAGAISTGLRSVLEYIGGSFRVLTTLLDATGAGSFFWQFTASGTWNKPTGLDDDRMVFVEAWGAGGGGASATVGGGGGGGAYISGWFRAGDLPSSASVTIGAGGAVNNAGGNTAFGALLTARGAGAASGANGGFGAGALASARLGGGGGGNGSTAAVNGGDGQFESGGGGGGAGGGSGIGAGAGGNSYRGGGGGAGATSFSPTTNVGGTSIFAGNGGGSNVAGSAPAGGGGRNAAGARGEVRIWI